MAPTINKIPKTITRTSTNSRSGMTSVFSTTRRDKRIIKRSALISRIEKSKAKPSSEKRRRPSKKLVTSLESLADALPDIPDKENGETVLGDAKIKHKSLKSKPGAMKKKERLISIEKERFNKNMAQMMQSDQVMQERKDPATASDAKEETGNKWAAIRGFIQQTMEQRPGSAV